MNIGINLGFEPRHFIGFLGQFHTSIASLTIGIAFLVTVAQVVGYRYRIRRHDLFAKRTQLFAVCIYNIGTINAIGLVFALSGLFPQFWEQAFVHFFWPLIIEEFIFALLATTITFHYFFWDHIWGHKKLHIFMGALLTPLFFLQFYFINGIGGFMLTPGSQLQEGTLSLARGILGWDKTVFFHPSFLMLQLHRTFANVSYGSFFMAGWCGLRLFQHHRDPVKREYYEDNGRLAFYVALVALLALPIVGYFYSEVLQKEASEAFWNLMLGRGDVILWGIDLWWVKHIFVAVMLGAGLGFFRNRNNARLQERFSLPRALIYAVAVFYVVFYLAMGMIMTWTFFWWMLAFAVAGFLLGTYLMKPFQGSGRLVFMIMGVLAFGTVLLGGVARESSRPRFVNRYSHYDKLYVPEERQPVLMVDLEAPVAEAPAAPPAPARQAAAELIATRCTACHGLDQVRSYTRGNWRQVVDNMIAYGASLSEEEARLVVEHLEAGLPY